MDNRKLMLIDGNSLLYRAFYALPLLHNSQGVYTNAVYGFLTMLKRLQKEREPAYIVVAFDKERRTFRNDIYTDYKGTRSKTPDELVEQFQIIRDVLTALNISYLEVQGYEADDIIGTLSKKAADEGIENIIVTGDKDSLQLVSEKTKVYLNKKGISEIEVYDTAKVEEKWEVSPEKMVEIKALMGDASDNIPGVPGVGPKTAVKLIKEYGNLENLYENVEKVKGKKLQENLTLNKDKAFISRKLGTIVCDLNIDVNIDDLKVKEARVDELIDLYRKLEFKNMIVDLEGTKIEKAIEFVQETVEINELNTKAEVRELLENIKPEDEVALLLEADYHHPMWAKIIKLWLEYSERVFCLEIDGKLEKLEWVQEFLQDEKYGKYLHNAKFAQVILKKHGVELKGIRGDTLLLSYVLDPSFQGDELKDIIVKYLQEGQGGYSSAGMVLKIRPLYKKLESLASSDLLELFKNMEMPLSGILAEMEYSGVMVDKKILSEISADLAGRLGEDEKRIYELAGTQFNINSPKQLGKVLFEDMGLPVVKKTKTGYATGAEVLEKLIGDHEIISYILDYRQLGKLKSTYADSLQELINPDTGRVHTIFKQATTATGRLSSVEPNLQNIPVKMEEGRRIRRAFGAAGRDTYIFSADYSQIDLRALAHISEDEILIETFKKGIDIHTRTASEIFQVPLSQVNSDLRRRAKAVNFGIIYGISDFGLARDTGVSRKEAGRYIEQYLNSYPGVQKYMEDIVTFGKKHGYVETALKRRRYLPDLNAKNKMLQSFARRMALNTPIQGTSSDIIKLAMIKVDRELKARGIKARMLLQVHDELLFEVGKNEIEELAYLVKDCMENAYSLKVPLLATMKAGKNWYEMQDWE